MSPMYKVKMMLLKVVKTLDRNFGYFWSQDATLFNFSPGKNFKPSPYLEYERTGDSILLWKLFVHQYLKTPFNARSTSVACFLV